MLALVMLAVLADVDAIARRLAAFHASTGVRTDLGANAVMSAVEENFAQTM